MHEKVCLLTCGEGILDVTRLAYSYLDILVFFLFSSTFLQKDKNIVHFFIQFSFVYHSSCRLHRMLVAPKIPLALSFPAGKQRNKNL